MLQTEAKHCLLCRGTLEAGFPLDLGTHKGVLQQDWAAGEPHPHWWTGIKAPTRQYAIRSYRCTSCGFLMEFAHPPESE